MSHCAEATCEDAYHAARTDYLDRLMRRASFEALWPLFARGTRPAKELTESFSALVHLRRFLAGGGPKRVLHVGDGAHARTAALFALKTKAANISVDPIVNGPLVQAWRDQFNVERFSWKKARAEDVTAELNALPPMPTFVTFVHAHVCTDRILTNLRWDAAFTLACCVPGKQLTSAYAVVDSGLDENVLASGRRYQVIVNRRVASAPGVLLGATEG